MPNLYVTEQGSVVKKEGGVIRAEKDGENLFEHPLNDISTMVLFGGVQVSTQAMLALLDEGCDIAIMTQNGHFRGRVTPALGKNSLLRAAQYDFFRNKETSLNLAKQYVAAKVRNSKQLLTAYSYNANNPFKSETLHILDKYIEDAEKTENIDSLRGYEGAAAAFYWECYGKCFTCGIPFTGRNYYPSKDPINALLSFGYSFIARELQAIIEACGMDPFIGFYHQLEYGRASLSLDMMEEYRAPVVDRLVLRLFNKGMLTTDNFEPPGDKGQVYLKKESQRIFISYYEEWMDQKNVSYGRKEPISWRKVMWSQVEALRRSIQENTPYKPYTLPEEWSNNEVAGKF